MIRTLLVVILLLFVGIIALTAYLGPDDLRSCASTPTDGACKKADAIVVVSGGDTAARVSEGVRLYKNDWADTIVFSGAAEDKSGPSNARAMQQIALDAGVPEYAILIEEYSETTKQNAENTVALIGGDKIERIILVTSGYHQRRASLEFNKRFDSTVEVVNHPAAVDSDWSSWWWLTPRGWYLAMSELSKGLVFYVGGTR